MPLSSVCILTSSLFLAWLNESCVLMPPRYWEDFSLGKLPFTCHANNLILPLSIQPLHCRWSLSFFSPSSSSQVEEELLEQEFLERCFQEMLEEEDQDWFIPSRDLNNQGVGQLQQQLNGLSVSDHHSNLEEVAVSQRTHLIWQQISIFFLSSHRHGSLTVKRLG